jgi:hypothetical protein
MANLSRSLTTFGRDLNSLLDRAGLLTIREYAEEANIDYKYVSQLRNNPNRRPGRSYVSMLKPFVKRNVLDLREAQQLSLRHRARPLTLTDCKELFPALLEEELIGSIKEVQISIDPGILETPQIQNIEKLKKVTSPEFSSYVKEHVSLTQWNELNAVLKEMGVVEGTFRLSESRWEPIQCMAQTRRKLRFMGIVGSKWVSQDHVHAEFQQFSRRIQAKNGEIRFLLMNPKGTAISRLRTLRGGALSVESLERFKSLMEEFNCLQVKLCDQMPSFRLVFIDDRIVAISRYKLDKEGYYQSRFGWEAPHLVIDSSAPWSLYDAFECFYDQVWNTSIDL